MNCEDSSMIDEKSNVLCNDNQQKHFKRRWNKNLFFTGLLTTIGSAVVVGYNIGVINAPAQILKSWINETLNERHDLTLNDYYIDIIWSSIVSIFLIGGAIGSFAGSFIANRYGRRGSYLICSFLFILGSISFHTCRMTSSVELLTLGRLLVGTASGLTTTILPMWLSEIAPLELRGVLGVFCSMGVTGGVVVGQIISLPQIFGNTDYWHICLSFQLFIVVLCTIPYAYFPESPKFILTVQKDRSKAIRELLKLCDSQEMAEYEFELMKDDTDVQNQSLKSVLTNPKLMLPLVLCAVMQGGQQLSGINAVFYYSVSIFESIGFAPNNAKWANLGCGCLNLFVAFFSPYLMEKCNRRPLMLLSCTCCSFFLVLISICYSFSSVLSVLSSLCIVSLFGYIIFYQIGLGPIPYFSGSELFEVETRAVAMSMGSLSSWFFNFVIGMTFPLLQRGIGASVFLIFAVVCAALAGFLKIYMPETRCKDISEIAEKVSDGFRSRPMMRFGNTSDTIDGNQ